MFKKFIIPKSVIIIFIIICILPLTASESKNKIITPEEFFCELITRLDININGLEEKYKYCGPYTAYLVDARYITPYQAHLLTTDKYIAESLIDKGFLIVNYFERPLDKGNYRSIIDRTAKETGLVDKTFDTSKELSYSDAIDIINKLASNSFNRIKYSDNIDLKIKYKIDNFQNMSQSLIRTSHYINMLPQKYIDDFNKQGFYLHITENVPKIHPDLHITASAYIDFASKKICIMKNFERDILHEFGHFAFSNLNNYPNICVYLFNTENNEGMKLKAVSDSINPYEYCADIFASFIQYRNDKDFITNFKTTCPITYNFFINNF